jgi:hypothetical protein
MFVAAAGALPSAIISASKRLLRNLPTGGAVPAAGSPTFASTLRACLSVALRLVTTLPRRPALQDGGHGAAGGQLCASLQGSCCMMTLIHALLASSKHNCAQSGVVLCLMSHLASRARAWHAGGDTAAPDQCPEVALDALLQQPRVQLTLLAAARLGGALPALLGARGSTGNVQCKAGTRQGGWLMGCILPSWTCRGLRQAPDLLPPGQQLARQP